MGMKNSIIYRVNKTKIALKVATHLQQQGLFVALRIAIV